MNAKSEKPTLQSFRLYSEHRKMVKILAKKLNVSEAQVVREAIEQKYSSEK